MEKEVDNARGNVVRAGKFESRAVMDGGRESAVMNRVFECQEGGGRGCDGW